MLKPSKLGSIQTEPRFPMCTKWFMKWKYLIPITELLCVCGTDNSLINVRANLVTEAGLNEKELCGETIFRVEPLWLELTWKSQYLVLV